MPALPALPVSPRFAARDVRRFPLPAPALYLLLAVSLPVAALTGGCGRSGEGGTVAASVPKADAQKTQAAAQETLPQSSPHNAARQASGADAPRK